MRITANSTSFSCVHCGASAGFHEEMTVIGFMRKLRAFERMHNRCAPAARSKSIEAATVSVIQKVKASAAGRKTRKEIIND